MVIVEVPARGKERLDGVRRSDVEHAEGTGRSDIEHEARTSERVVVDSRARGEVACRSVSEHNDGARRRVVEHEMRPRGGARRSADTRRGTSRWCGCKGAERLT